MKYKTLRQIYPHIETFTPFPEAWEKVGITRPEQLTTHLLDSTPGFGRSGVLYLALGMAKEIARLQREIDERDERLSRIAALALNEE